MTDPDRRATGLRCHLCDYDLREQPAHGWCPECGASVADARRHARTAVRSNLVLIGAGAACFVCHLAVFVVVFAIDRFAIFAPLFLLYLHVAPLVAAITGATTTIVLKKRGVRLHWLALVAFLGAVAFAWLIVAFLVMAASMSV